MRTNVKRVDNPHLRRMLALAYVIPKRANQKAAADVWFAEAKALLSSPSDKPKAPRA